ncbi:MAG: hypothetical protein ABGY11_09690 [Candidatus Thioglobus sp.]|jgi:hypothetical protein
MSAHGEEGNEGKHTTIGAIITNLEYILKEHCEKIKLIESHLLFMKEQIEQEQETKKEFRQLD